MATRAILRQRIADLEKNLNEQWQVFCQLLALYYTGLGLGFTVNQLQPRESQCQNIWKTVIIIVGAAIPFILALLRFLRAIGHLTRKIKKKRAQLGASIGRNVHSSDSEWSSPTPLLESGASHVEVQAEGAVPELQTQAVDKVKPVSETRGSSDKIVQGIREEQEQEQVLEKLLKVQEGEISAASGPADEVKGRRRRGWWSWHVIIGSFYFFVLTALTSYIIVSIACYV